MLLYSIEDPSLEDSWFHGRPFTSPPTTPIIVGIQEGYEKSHLLPFFGTPPVMSNEFYRALVAAGVDNLDVYDSALQSDDKKVVYEGFKAFNVLGLVRAADLEKTPFEEGNPSRLVDASITNLPIDPERARDLSLFRLAEYAGAVIVHERIKQALEKLQFPGVVFRDPADFVS